MKADFRFFRARLCEIQQLTPSFRRFSFAGPDLAGFGDPGFDQRIKIVFPAPGADLEVMPTGEDWYQQWLELGRQGRRRPPFRTYTTRGRRENGQVDIDMVLHNPPAGQDLGPAGRWAHEAQIGDEVLLLGPTSDQIGPNTGVDFVPPAQVGHLLLVGDETAAPAIGRILEQYRPDVPVSVVAELPDEGDFAYLPRRENTRYYLGARAEQAQRGHHFIAGGVRVLDQLFAPGQACQVTEIDPDRDLMWEVPRTARGGAALEQADVYAWLAGEASAVTALRRHLVAERGVDRRAVAFMGYWRAGRAEN